MQTVDLIGACGVFMILCAFVLQLSGYLQKGQPAYLLLNFVGGTLACTASVLMEYIPFIILEGFWALISLGALAKLMRGVETKNSTSLAYLLKHMQPKLKEEVFVYSQVSDAHPVPQDQIAATIQEQEGLTLILSKEVAHRQGLPMTYEAAWITLEVHSDLEAVGFTAAFAQALGEAEISCNVLAGYAHDHLLVPYEQRQEAIQALKRLAAQS
ncbi:MAG: ACT domain-containing protein [Bacteroidota bacterium]